MALPSQYHVMPDIAIFTDIVPQMVIEANARSTAYRITALPHYRIRDIFSRYWHYQYFTQSRHRSQMAAAILMYYLLYVITATLLPLLRGQPAYLRQPP
jgi:hypothetical protein